MKNLVTIATLALSAQLFAQVSGNINQPNAAGNYNYNEAAGNIKMDKGNANINYNVANTSTKATTSLPVAYIQNDMLTLEVSALSNKTADAYVAMFSITQAGETASEAEQLLQVRYDGFVLEAMKLGIKKEDIYLDMISFVPLYEYEVEKKTFSKNYNEVPKGFEIQQNIHVKYTNRDMASKLVSAAAKNEIYDIVKVDYFVENQEAIYHELRQKAIEYIQKQTVQFKGLGIDLDTTFRIFAEQESVAYPIERYSSYQAFASTSIEGKKGKAAVNNIRKPRTMFYDHIPYNSFQIVLNPTTLEPAVQFMYNIKVQYTIKRPVQTVTKNQKEFVWLTPQGTQLTLKLDEK